MFNEIEDGFEWRGSHQVLRAQAWGTDGIRVRAALSNLREDLPGALGERPRGRPGSASATPPSWSAAPSPWR